MATAAQSNNDVFQLKGSLFTLTVLQLQQADIHLLQEKLAKQIAQTPKLFNNMPIVIDLQKIHRNATTLDFTALLNAMRELKLIPIGVRGGTTLLNESAIAAGLAIMPASQNVANTELPAADALPIPQSASLVITKPVRSGQQFYAEGGDLIVLASVSHGAELLADGNIHIYGALRGRALAGVNNDANAHIFCHELDAELIAIAGHYMVKEDLNKIALTGDGFTHIYLQEKSLRFEKLAQQNTLKNTLNSVE